MPTATDRDPGPTLPEVEMHIHRPDAPTVGTVVENRICTARRKAASFVHHLVIDVSKTDLAGRFRVGQAFGVIPPGETEHGTPHKVRLYSIACPTGGEDGTGNLLATTVKRTIDESDDDGTLLLGVASNYLCDCKPGDEIRLTGPAGKRFLLPAAPQEHDYAFFATGTGIAPFRGMVRELLAANTGSQVALVMGSPYATDLLYHDEFTQLAREHDNFTYLTALSRQPQTDGGDPMYADGRFRTHTETFRSILESPRGLVYCCGLAGMEVGVIRGLAETLSPEALARYVRVNPDIAGEPQAWTRRMIPREIAPTRRLFLEVY